MQIGLIGALLVLLPVLAVLQYRWIGQISAAEQQRLRQNLQVASTRLAFDISSELRRIGTGLQGPPPAEELYAETLAQRFRQWAAMATHADLVDQIFVVAEKGGPAGLFRLDVSGGRLDPSDWPKEWSMLRDFFLQRLAGPPGPPMAMPPMGFATEDGIPILILPTPSGSPGPFRERGFGPGGPPRGGRMGFFPMPASGPESLVLVRFNAEALSTKYLPDLVRNHFPPGDVAEYQIAVGIPGSTRLVYFSGVATSPDTFSMPDVAVDIFPQQGPLVGPPPARPDPPMIQPRRGPGVPGGGLPVMVAGAAWQVMVRHRSGSLDAAVSTLRRRNLAISYGILAILGLGIILVIVSGERARSLGKLQMEFAAGISHELRTPLAVIRSAAYNLATDVVQDSEGVHRYAEIVQDEARRLSDMVDQVLLFAETQSGRRRYKIEATDIGEAIERALRIVSPRMDPATCRLQRHVEPDLPPVRTDAVALTQCLQNLLNNALKYGRTGDVANVDISAKLSGNRREVELSVADQGPGIAAEDLPHLFEPFYRGKAVAPIPGSGLGLNLVQRIMSGLGGRVSVDSKPGDGARFTLHVPL